MVVESAAHGPELCLGGVTDWLPPQCGGVPLIGWDWTTFEGEQSSGGTTWTDSIIVTGVYDGTTLTVTDAHAPTEADLAGLPRPPELRAPCPEPEGGWLAAAADAPVDRGSNLGIGEYVDTQPDHVGWYYDRSLNPDVDSGIDDPHKFIIVALFTGDIERHEAALKEIWPGALCVAEAERSAAEVEAIATQVLAGLGPDSDLVLPNGTTLHVYSYSPSGDPLTGTVPIDVWVVPPGAQEYFDATYGPGIVVLNGQLVPVG